MGRDSKKQGIALISALSFMVITAIFVGIALLVSVSNKRLSSSSSQTYRAQLAAEAGLENALYQSFYQLKPTKDESYSLENIRSRLDEIKLYAASKEGLPVFGEKLVFTGQLANGENFDVQMRRIDLKTKTIIRLDSIGYLGEKDNKLAIRRISQDIEFIEALPDSAGFAVLSNSSKGLFTNSIISTMETAYENSSLLNLRNLSIAEREMVANNYRVKVASLKAIYDSSKEVNSLLTGTIYSRGRQQILASNKLRGIPFKLLNGKDSSVLSNKANTAFYRLKVSDCARGCEVKNASFYDNYPKGNGPDIDLIADFPYAIRDSDKDNSISQQEWLAEIARGNAGQLKGGKKELFGKAGLSTGKTLVSGPSGIEASTILQGTKTDPLVIKDSVYFDGDVVISGNISGSGRIIARGNIYLVGDIRYACDDNSQDFKWQASARQNCDYSKPENLPRLGLLSAKNIVIGDYVGWQFNKNSSEMDADIALQLAFFNQREFLENRSHAKYYSLKDKLYRCSKCRSKDDLVEIAKEDLARASIISLAPKNDYLAINGMSSETRLHNIWQQNIESNIRGLNPALHIDALLHANHGVFGYLPTTSRTKASLQINGSVFAENIGLDAQGGLAIYYDNRLSQMINIEASDLRIRRSNYRLIKENTRLSYVVADDS